MPGGGRPEERAAIRRAAVAGSWYPRDPARLSAELDGYLATAQVERPPSLVAIVAPHAGLMYSGPVAAHAYTITSGRRFAAVILVGPSHFVPFDGVSIWPEGRWETPFGPVQVDRDLGDAIRSRSAVVIDMPEAHAREHSLEMHLPFVARTMAGVPIVPLVMGYQTRETAFALGDAVADAVAERDGPVLLVASTDLSHYEDAATAGRLDRVVLDHVERLDAGGLMDALEREPRHACGGGPTVAVLEAARRLGASRARVLRYADSGDVSGDKSAVVGYMAAAVW
jgi:hypothetical protein